MSVPSKMKPGQPRKRLSNRAWIAIAIVSLLVVGAAVGFFFLSSGLGGTPKVAAKPSAKDIAYASLSKAQTLDLYLPQGNGPFPLIVNIHGGGFMMGDKSDPVGGDQLLANGYAVASLNYRLSGEATFPAQSWMSKLL